MSGGNRSLVRPGRLISWRFLGGFLLAVSLFGVVAEAFLRLFPPRDLHSYLGEDSPLSGPFRADPDFGAAYCNWDAFHAGYADRLKLYLPLNNHPDARPTWAMFGNSFVQAPGMLADHARARVSDRKIFNLARNELFQVRLAQIPLLLEKGLQPERLFIEVMPVDLVTLGKQPLSTLRVTSRGALTYKPNARLAPLTWLTDRSRLALSGLVRTGRQTGNPRFKPGTLCQELDPILLGDVEHLFTSLARVCRARGVPVTIMLFPNHEQITSGASFNFQDILGHLFHPMGFDVFDPRAAFLARGDRNALFIPDKHYSDTGNELLLSELLTHLERLQKGKDVVLKRREQ